MILTPHFQSLFDGFLNLFDLKIRQLFTVLAHLRLTQQYSLKTNNIKADTLTDSIKDLRMTNLH